MAFGAATGVEHRGAVGEVSRVVPQRIRKDNLRLCQKPARKTSRDAKGDQDERKSAQHSRLPSRSRNPE
jgi:hypothetical protein